MSVLETLERKALALPAGARVELAEKLLKSVDDFVSPEIAAAWEQEIARRVAELESGCVTPIPADLVMAQARRKLDETRRLSSARRK